MGGAGYGIRRTRRGTLIPGAQAASLGAMGTEEEDQQQAPGNLHKRSTSNTLTRMVVGVLVPARRCPEAPALQLRHRGWLQPHKRGTGRGSD